MLSACTREFLSHPIEKEKSSLIKHLLEVAQKSKELFSQTKFENKDIAFYSGLFHDIGKINPFYQNIFHATQNNRKNIEKKSLENYVQEHSAFSAWTVDKLLENSGLDVDTIQKITVLVYGHHSTIRQELPSRNGDKFTVTKKAISEVLPKFKLQSSDVYDLSKLNWDSCFEEFQYPVHFNAKLSKSKNSPDDFLEMSYTFSCLLQADRGSFYDWSTPNFDLTLDTESLIKQTHGTKCILGKFRTIFQSEIMRNFDSAKPISIINAPTGIGKTKVFLDVMKKYSVGKSVERVFYFSPLLALTDDFEGKLTNEEKPVISKEEQEDVLIYTSLYSGSLQEKNKSEEIDHTYSLEWFKNESFNKKFVISTTQRLLMTLYSNRAGDKMKMASFRNSVLIIDEVQTIPKPILSNLKWIFRKMNQYMGTKFILVSATIPHEISDIKPIKLPKDLLPNYLLQTKKQISFAPFNVEKIPIEKTLVMANTRKKAVTRYSEIDKAHPDKDILYISTGIKKQDRMDIIKNLPKSDYVLVSTQVVEAGADISFSHIFREEAPLDNIIQVMGRLNREGENQNAKLVVYPTDGKPDPYSSLEFQVSQEKIKKITRERNNSVGLYDIMEEYYSEIYERNKSNQNDTQELEQHIERMDFDGVWEFVRKLAFREDDRDTIFIPSSENWMSVKEGLLNGIPKKNFKAFGKLTASLPIPFYKLEEKEGKKMFDEDLMEKNILLPKKQYLEKIYHEKMGLDKWLME